MRKIYLASTIVPIWLGGVMIERGNCALTLLFMCLAAVLLYKGGVCEPEQYDNSTPADL